LLAFTLLSATDLAGQQRLRATPSVQAQPFSVTWTYLSVADNLVVWLRLNTTTGQLYQIQQQGAALKQGTVNATPLIAPTDASAPGRFALFPAGFVNGDAVYAPVSNVGTSTTSIGVSAAVTTWLLLDQQTGAAWLVAPGAVTPNFNTFNFSFTAVPGV